MRSGLALAAATLLALALSQLAPGAPAPPTLLAVGDIASCDSNGDEQTAALVTRLPGTIAVLGDIAYERGTAADFSRCFQPSWGPLVPRIRAALGNHEYGSGSAEAAITLFRLPPRGWYSYELGRWHVIVLNSNCGAAGGCERGSDQWRWLAGDLAAHRAARCTLAYWHHPRLSSGLHGSDPRLAALWGLLAAKGADIVLQGHDHDYERFAPVDGIRSFVVGTGGRSLYPFLRPEPRSVVRNAETYGVLRLTLRPRAYDWRFLPVVGSSFHDSGTAACH